MDIKKIVIVFCSLFLTLNAQGQNDACSIRNTSFKDNEQLMFRVYYNVSFVWINAGNVQFNTKPDELNGRKMYHITGDGKTAKSYVFFKVNDRYETYIDKETLLPARFVRNVSEGGIKFTQDVTFDQKKRQAVSKQKAYSLPKCTQDVLSAIYFARNINYDSYKPGDKIPFSMFLDDQVYNLYIKYIGKEKVKTKMGTYNAIKISPLLIEGTIFKGGDKMTVYVSDDANHLPLRIESPILVGSIKVDLIGYDNLRNPFTSIVSKETSKD